MSLRREGSSPSLSSESTMRDNYIDKLLNPSDEELKDDMSARSSVEEQWPSKPLVAGSNPAGCILF